MLEEVTISLELFQVFCRLSLERETNLCFSINIVAMFHFYLLQTKFVEKKKIMKGREETGGETLKYLIHRTVSHDQDKRKTKKGHPRIELKV